ncbi:lysozyme-like protein [Rhizobium phage RHph_TM39]|uniref:Lysozyme-like protein n=2 Tax=Cuauhnahuacvirus TaxID=3044696 RepID=A0A7S5R802_9CAUD|nr:lysozyme-like protein [Rhizobium phage RHph_TM30]YP_010671398.1 lysozyme-like protein [Rhizobium phage RHph_Y65]QIG71720.1 lysozyme-like protein [Rhizobium phage RHph_TM40]QIG72083.1 lysozyme-like protein [Rhizobium phage RHph_TM2_3B]QIG72445.1 lysozyme-like protein [Rhizobium phage RHph_TM3_3_6]QIG77221.1 lysozyme-like protein [Rhizobium phage RHph_TM39]QIG77526.1 lysozyme-like protein [Rhizobium phage RHph_TM21B]QIG77835.1 lysozyme-like protein [Rhizobium phage RHph_TM61]
MKIYTVIVSIMLALISTSVYGGEVITRKVGYSSRSLIVSEAAKYGISKAVIEHVARKESTFRCTTGGRYKGPLQISPRSARALGYQGKGGLDNCGDGLKYGLRHLAICVKKVGQNPKKAASCHASPGAYGVRVVWR